LLITLTAFMPRSLAFAQTASDMDTLLKTDSVSVATASSFILGAADLLPAGLSGPDAEKAAYDLASSNGWIKAQSGDPITLKETSFLIMKAFKLKGGLMYSLFGSPRYAYREMVYQKLIIGSTDQSMKLSGPKLLQIIDSTLNHSGGY